MSTTNFKRGGRARDVVLAAIALLCAVFLFRLLPGNRLPAAGQGAEQDNPISGISRIRDHIPHTKTLPAMRQEPAVRPATGLTTSPASILTTSSLTTTSTAEGTTQSLSQEAYITRLLELKAKDGRDNALLHYAMAFELAPANPTDAQLELIKMVLREGWDERAESLLPYLTAWEAAFEEIRKGTQLDYAMGIGVLDGVETPVPNFLRAQNSSRMLAVYARYLASQGKGEQAADQVMTAMTMGRDFTSPDNLLISHLIGTAIQHVALKQLDYLVASNTIGVDQLPGMLQRLHQLEITKGSFQSALDSEFAMSTMYFQKIRANPDQELQRQETAEHRANMQNLISNLDKYDELNRHIWSTMSTMYGTPYWERDRKAIQAELEALAAKLPTGQHIPDMGSAEVRFISLTSRLRHQQIQVALQRWTHDQGRLPPDLQALVSRGYISQVPVDPFSGGSYHYSITSEDRYELYGTGPLGQIHAADRVAYDPTNGTFSAGVIGLR